MADEKPAKSDVVLIKDYFFKGTPSKEVIPELKKLTVEEKKQLGDGIRNGSMTY